MIFSYIKFQNTLSDSLYDGFVIEAGEDKRLCLPISFLMLEKQNMLSDIFNEEHFDNLYDFISWSDNQYSVHKRPTNDAFLSVQDWILDFPLQNEDLSVINKIGTFFEYIALNPSLIGVNNAINNVGRLLPNDLLERLKVYTNENVG